MTAQPPVETGPKTNWTLREMLLWATGYLEKKGSLSPRLDVELLLAHVLHVPRIQLYVQFERVLQASEKDQFRGVLTRRAQGEPIAYILGTKGFMSHTFAVNPHVLIPRSDTECLVEAVLQDHAAITTPLRILDAGTGSGCILLSLLKARPQDHGIGWDISPGALQVAQHNAQRLEIPATQLALHLRDMSQAESWATETSVQILVSNPPYIAPEEESELSPSVRSYEPREALFAPDSGVFFYKKIQALAGNLLAPGAKVYLEMGHLQSGSVVEIFSTPAWCDTRLIPDLQGIPRVLATTYTGVPPR